MDFSADTVITSPAPPAPAPAAAIRLATATPQTAGSSSGKRPHDATAVVGEDDPTGNNDVDSDGNPRDKRTQRRKINIQYIEDKSRRHITFSKRKAGLMKKSYELATLTGTQVLLLVVSETGLVYTFTTPKLQPLVTRAEGKNFIQACLNAPDGGDDGGGSIDGYEALNQAAAAAGIAASTMNYTFQKQQELQPSGSWNSSGVGSNMAGATSSFSNAPGLGDDGPTFNSYAPMAMAHLNQQQSTMANFHKLQPFMQSQPSASALSSHMMSHSTNPSLVNRNSPTETSATNGPTIHLAPQASAGASPNMPPGTLPASGRGTTQMLPQPQYLAAPANAHLQLLDTSHLQMLSPASAAINAAVQFDTPNSASIAAEAAYNQAAAAQQYRQAVLSSVGTNEVSEMAAGSSSASLHWQGLLTGENLSEQTQQLMQQSDGNELGHRRSSSQASAGGASRRGSSHALSGALDESHAGLGS